MHLLVPHENEHPICLLFFKIRHQCLISPFYVILLSCHVSALSLQLATSVPIVMSNLLVVEEKGKIQLAQHERLHGIYYFEKGLAWHAYVGLSSDTDTNE